MLVQSGKWRKEHWRVVSKFCWDYESLIWLNGAEPDGETVVAVATDDAKRK